MRPNRTAKTFIEVTLEEAVELNEVDEEIITLMGADLGVVDNGEPPQVLEVSPGSPMAEEGITDDDVLVAINGQETKGLPKDHIIHALRTAFTLRFERQPKRLEGVVPKSGAAQTTIPKSGVPMPKRAALLGGKGSHVVSHSRQSMHQVDQYEQFDQEPNDAEEPGNPYDVDAQGQVWDDHQSQDWDETQGNGWEADTLPRVRRQAVGRGRPQHPYDLEEVAQEEMLVDEDLAYAEAQTAASPKAVGGLVPTVSKSAAPLVPTRRAPTMAKGAVLGLTPSRSRQPVSVPSPEEEFEAEHEDMEPRPKARLPSPAEPAYQAPTLSSVLAQRSLAKAGGKLAPGSKAGSKAPTMIGTTNVPKGKTPLYPKQAGMPSQQAHVGAKAAAKAKAAWIKHLPVEEKVEAEETRVDPTDGKAYTFRGLQEKYTGSYTPMEIQTYWDSEMANVEMPEPEEVAQEEDVVEEEEGMVFENQGCVYEEHQVGDAEAEFEAMAVDDHEVVHEAAMETTPKAPAARRPAPTRAPVGGGCGRSPAAPLASTGTGVFAGGRAGGRPAGAAWQQRPVGGPRW